MFFRYTHLRAEDVAEKIHSMQSNDKFDLGMGPWATLSLPDSQGVEDTDVPAKEGQVE